MRPVIPYVTAALLFGLGVYGVLRRRNAVLVLMAVELMLNAVNLILVTADTTAKAVLPHGGQVFALFVIVLAAAEIGVGLAIVLQLYRMRASVTVDEIPLAERPADEPVPVAAGPIAPTGAGPIAAGPDGRHVSGDEPEGQR
ncbi:NADH-quinone oxidoreductase subunit NuoK [Verrucosispora sp. WMMA2121]|uniref:NADH-quinone oxidoreductase subunit NuoK n=1 Tax=Verrucosispora sp. WMMA2121 TaxID=3015164 RepID=UPI0022B751B5|nr:NADH-quinone oxidoreductase subunit NuoK [Verrucosispora sp. WMMA2121]MCZ7419167.1 NADH-quinone oxidoreductase subunit NuoK [Verrucosispora sp. WMMA2121]